MAKEDKADKKMAQTLKLNKIAKQGGKVYFRFDNGHELEFGSLADVKEFVRDTLTPEVLEAIWLRIALDREPNLASVVALEGRTITIDTALANWGKVA